MDFSAADVQRRIDAVIYKNSDAIAGGAQAHVGHTPLDDLMAKEEGDEAAEMVSAVRQETLSRMLDYMFADGCEPINVVRRVFALVKALRPDLIGDMSQEDIAVLCGDGGRATVSARIKRVYNFLLDENGGARGKSRVWHQKSAAAVEAYARAQQGNDNRGKKGKAKRHLM